MDSIFDSVQWVWFSVGMLANANNFNNELNLKVYLHQPLVVLDRECAKFHNAAFQLSLVNLIHLIMSSKEQIINNKGII